VQVSGRPDAVVVGSGPNGLAAALRMASAGLSVQVVESAPAFGGGLRSGELTLPGFTHDHCATVHPFTAASPFFTDFDLAARGVRLVQPEIPFAHPLDGGRAGLAHHSLDRTATELGSDGRAWRRLFQPLVDQGQDVVDFFLASAFRRLPTRAPVATTRFGLLSLTNVHALASHRFQGDEAQGLLAGAAAHGMLELDRPVTSGLGLILTVLAHRNGWPVIEGGSQRLADAMIAALEQAGGEVVPGHEVTDLREFAGVPAVLLDVTPRAFVRMSHGRLPRGYARWVDRYVAGPGVFKVDWALSGPVPWTNAGVRAAGTVHVVGDLSETVAAEAAPAQGRVAGRPFVLVVQPTVVDPTRAPVGRHVLYAYCHVPYGSTVDMTAAIEAQIERFAPGFRDLVLARHTMNAVQVQEHNASNEGGDIAKGETSLRQMLFRPVPRWNTYRTPLEGVYLASAATPPGPAVHGMCGDNAARQALRDVFGIADPPRLGAGLPATAPIRPES
jgi:phytoene dehydrogenase-like protein